MQAIYLAVARRDARSRELAARAEAVRCPVHLVDDERLARLAGGAAHQGVVAVVDAAMPHVTLDDVFDALSEPALLLVLDGVTDPHNLGACLRNADAFGAHAVVAAEGPRRGRQRDGREGRQRRGRNGSGRSPSPTSRVRCATSRSGDVWILGADAGGENLFDADVSGPVAWVLGAEGRGPAPAHPRALRPDRRNPALGKRREPQRFGRERNLPLRDARARRAGTALTLT